MTNLPTATRLLDSLSDAQSLVKSRAPSQKQKQHGQIFTPVPVARFMARLISSFPKVIKILDPGAGTGTLAMAACEQVLELRSSRQITLYLFENDPKIIPSLQKNMEASRLLLAKAGHSLNYKIEGQDFLCSDMKKFGIQGIDAVLMNPPYFKIGKESQHAQTMSHVVHGQPNIYALFLARAVEVLREGGEIIAITPRSFCNGPYFRTFRRWFFDRMTLGHVHLFESRKDTFRHAQVLQENVITASRKSYKTGNTISVSTSHGRDLPSKVESRDIPANIIFDDSAGDRVLRIPENTADLKIIRLIDSWPQRFTDLGLRVSTGPVVSFRSREFLLDSMDGNQTTALLSLHNVRPFLTVWPLEKKNRPTAFKICSDSQRLLLPTKNYVLLRRFSAKEERRRLTASCFFRRDYSRSSIALENHLNYIYHAFRELTEDEVYGIAGLFNSALLDRYFRTISGNTQVNAAEIRTIKFPELKTVSRIGKRVRDVKLNAAAVEEIVLDEVVVDARLKNHLTQLVA